MGNRDNIEGADRLPGSQVNGVPQSGGAQSSAHRPRVMLYSHDTMGIGHVRRNLLIAQALTGPPVSATVMLIAGAREAGAFSLPPAVDCLTLPSLHKTESGQYRTRTLNLALQDLIAMRAKIISAAVESFEPDLFIADKEPRGAVRELDPTMEILRN